MANINGTVQDQTLTSKTSTQLAQMHGTSPDPFQFRRGDGLEWSVNMMLACSGRDEVTDYLQAKVKELRGQGF